MDTLQLEYLRNIAGGVINMTNTVIGGGISIIACPYGIRYLGPYGFIICELIIAFFTFLSLCLMIDVSTHVNSKDLSRLVKPLHICCFTFNMKFIKKFMDAIIVLNCGGVLVIFLDTMLTVTTNIISNTNDWNFWLLISLTLIFTYCLCLLKNTKSARPASSLAVIFWISFLIFIYYNALTITSHANTHQHESNPFIGITSINLTWTCQFKALPIYQNLNRSYDAKKVFFIMVIIALCIYLSLGFAAYYSFHSISDSLINNLQPPFSDNIAFSDTVAYIAQICLGISIFFTNPIFFIEVREHLLLLIDYKNWKWSNHNMSFDSNDSQYVWHKYLKTQPMIDENDEKDEIFVDPNISFKSVNGISSKRSLEQSKDKEVLFQREYSNISDHKHHDLPLNQRYFPTFIIVLVCVSLVVIGETILKNKFDLIGTMINFIGGIAANSIAWLIPAILYFGNRNTHRNQYRNRNATIVAILLLLVFCVVFCSWILSFVHF